MKIWHFIKRYWRSLLVTTIGSIVGIVFVAILQRDTNLATSLVAFGTLLLAVVTATMIDNSRQQEKRRRKEELLKEIIQWATDIDNCMYRAVPALATTDKREEQELSRALLLELLVRFRELRGRNQYICKSIDLTFGRDLQKAANDLTGAVKEHARLLNEWYDAIGTNIPEKYGSAQKNADCHRRQLTSAVTKVIEEATKIKTRDIG